MSHLRKSDQDPMEHLAGMEPKPGDRAICSMCGEWIEFVGPYWQHAGLPPGVQPKHPAWPREPVPEPEYIGVGDAPDDEDEPETSGFVTIGKEIRQTPDLPASVADLYRVLSEQLTPVQQTMLKAFWLLMAEDSRMLDWLEAQIKVSDSGMRNGLIMVWGKRKDNSLRAIIKERMSDDD